MAAIPRDVGTTAFFEPVTVKFPLTLKSPLTPGNNPFKDRILLPFAVILIAPFLFQILFCVPALLGWCCPREAKNGLYIPKRAREGDSDG